MGKIVQNEIVFGRSTSRLAQLTDVDITTTPPTEGQALLWDSVNQVFRPGNVGGGLTSRQIYLRTTEYTTPDQEET